MKVVCIIGHQKKGSFCHAISATVTEELTTLGHQVIYHDLYEEKFDPVLQGEEIPKEANISSKLEKYCRELKEANGYVIIHPNWWGQPPAILKGWIDRVFRQGVAYEFTADGKVNGMLKTKTALVFTTSNTPRDIEQMVYGDPLENLWRTCIFGFCGVERFQRRNFEPVIVSTAEQRKEWLKAVEATIREYFS